MNLKHLLVMDLRPRHLLFLHLIKEILAVTKNPLKFQHTHLALRLDIQVVELLDINLLLDRISNQPQHPHTKLMHSLVTNLAQDLVHSLATSLVSLLISLLQQVYNTQKLDSLVTSLALDLTNQLQLYHHIRKTPSLATNLVLVHTNLVLVHTNLVLVHTNLVLVHTNRLQHHQHSLKVHSIVPHLVLGLTNLLL